MATDTFTSNNTQIKTLHIYIYIYQIYGNRAVGLALDAKERDSEAEAGQQQELREGQEKTKEKRRWNHRCLMRTTLLK